MGSSKKHKSKESRKRKHHSRSSSEELNEKEKHRHHHHHKRHKEKKKEKQFKAKSDDSYDSDDDVVLVPPPPRISRPATPPPPNLVPPPPKISASSSPPPVSSSDQSLSIEETNKLRAKLGLKPLEVPSAAPAKKDDGSSPAKVMGGTDMGDFIHKPAGNIASKQRAEKIKAKIAERKEKRQLEAKLASIKKLAEDSDDDADTLAWVKKNRKLTEERLKAEKKAKELDDMDAVFGVGDLVEDDLRMVRKAAYTARDLKGLRVEHDVEGFGEGREVILTLKDKGVLDEEDDALVNVSMVDEERYKKNIERRKQKPHLFGYDALEENMDDDSNDPKILTKYDEEIEGEKKTSFVLGMDESRKKEIVRKKLHENKRIESLDLPKLQIASDYYTEEEINLKFKKPKKKVRKIRERKTKMVKADDLLADNNGSEDWLKDLGTRRQTHINVKPDPDAEEVSNVIVSPSEIKKETEDDPMDVDDLPPPPEDLDDIKLEQDDSELELALKKARKLKQKEAVEAMPSVVDKVAEMIIKTESPAYQAPGPGGSIVLNATAEFCRTLGDIPTYGLSGNRDEDAQELLDFDREMKEDKRFEEITVNRGGWNDVEMDDKPVDIVPFEAPILDEEPNLGSGVAGALRLAVSKGYLEKETTKRPSASRFAHLQAQNYSIEDKTHVEDEKFGRRERYCGPTSDFKEKDSYKPNVKLDYIDDNGHVLTAKEAFRYLSHKFHGKGPGKNKVEKRMKKGEQEVLMKQMSSTDTPLGTLNMLQQKQKETQSPFVVLSGNKQLQAASAISKTKL